MRCGSAQESGEVGDGGVENQLSGLLSSQNGVGFWVAQHFSAAIQALTLAGFSR
jgi:hypothetical protein